MKELRCPFWPKTMFGRCDTNSSGHLEVACRACRRQGYRDEVPLLVTHLFDLATGECVGTNETWET